MIATLTFLAAAQLQAADATNFSYKFTKDEKTAYSLEVTGSDDGTDVRLTAEFELTTKETDKDGNTPCTILVKSASANFGGQEMPMGESGQLDIVLNKHGVPTEVVMEGLDAVYFIAFVTRYLPNKPLKQGEAFKAEVTMGGSKFTTAGSFTGMEVLDGASYAVISSKGELMPDGDEPGTVSSKSFFDPKAGKVVRTESTLGTPGGDFKMVIKVKK